MNVFVMAADGSNVRQITYAVGSAGDLAPSWTPDGANLVYTERIGDAGQGEVWSIPSGGGRPVNLTRAAFTTTTWSPMSMNGVYTALCLPCNSLAANVATRPSTWSWASMTCHRLSAPLALPTNVRMQLREPSRWVRPGEVPICTR